MAATIAERIDEILGKIADCKTDVGEDWKDDPAASAMVYDLERELAAVTSAAPAEIEFDAHVSDFKLVRAQGRRGSEQLRAIRRLLGELAEVGVRPENLPEEVLA